MYIFEFCMNIRIYAVKNHKRNADNCKRCTGRKIYIIFIYFNISRNNNMVQQL